MTRTLDPSISTGPLRPADLDGLAALLGAHTGRNADRRTLGTWIDRHPSAGAWVDGGLVGFAVSQRFASDLVELTNLLVAPPWRAQGIGAALVSTLEAEARRRGAAGIVLVNDVSPRTGDPTRTAARLYRSLGYRAVLETEATIVFGRTLAPAP